MQGCGEKGTFMHCWWMQIGEATVESSMNLPQTLKIELLYDPGMSKETQNSNLKEETQNSNLKEDMLPYVRCRIIYNSQNLEAAQASISA